MKNDGFFHSFTREILRTKRKKELFRSVYCFLFRFSVSISLAFRNKPCRPMQLPTLGSSRAGSAALRRQTSRKRAIVGVGVGSAASAGTAAAAPAALALPLRCRYAASKLSPLCSRPHLRLPLCVRASSSGGNGGGGNGSSGGGGNGSIDSPSTSSTTTTKTPSPLLSPVVELPVPPPMPPSMRVEADLGVGEFDAFKEKSREYVGLFFQEETKKRRPFFGRHSLSAFRHLTRSLPLFNQQNHRNHKFS